MTGSPTFMPAPTAAPTAAPAPTERARPSSGSPAGDAALAFAAGDLTHADVLYRAAYEMGERAPAIIAARARLALWRGGLSEAENLAQEIDAQAPEAKVGAEVLEAAARRRNEDLEDVYHKSSSAPTTIPLLSRDPVPLVVGTINGRAGGLVIDTSVEQVMLSDTFAKILGVSVSHDAPHPFGAAKGGQGAAHGVLDRIDLGDLRVATVPVTVAPERQIAAVSPACDGEIGLAFLARFHVTIDYPHSQLILAPRNSAAKPGGRTPVQLWLVRGSELYVEAAIGTSERCMWRIDTGRKGAGLTLWDRGYAEQAGVLSAQSSPAQSRRAGSSAARGVTVAVMRLGDLEVHDAPAELTSSPRFGTAEPFKVGGVLSLAFFKQWSIAFDFEKMQLWLDQSQ